MTGQPLLLVMLLVSWTSLVLQAAALIHLRRQKAATGAEQAAGRGYVRTAAFRVTAAVVYVTVAVLQLAGVHVNGGSLTPEALVIFSAIQGLWLLNTAMDIRLRRRLRHDRPLGGA